MTYFPARLLVLSVLGACSAIPERDTFPLLSFANLEPIAIGVMAVDVKTNTFPSRLAPNVEHLSPVSFDEALTAWAEARFVPYGVGSIRLEVSLQTGTIHERRLTVDRGLGGLFKNEQAVEYEARIQVTMKAIGPDGVRHAEVESEAWQIRTLPEIATPTDRQLLLFEMVETTIHSMDRQIIPEFRQYFFAYIL